ncbi:MAG: glycosyltransferase family 4 protein [Acidobacteriaceae bacterium]|nr:glycosyltransferase family 4 protein [Acidobacteriaceae bacterium]
MKKNCVLVTPTLPGREGSGLQQRAFAWLLELAREYNVTLVLALPAENIASTLEARATQELQPYVTQIEICRATTSPKWLRLAALLCPLALLWKPQLADDWVQPLGWEPQLPEQIDHIHVFRFRTMMIGEFLARAYGLRDYGIDLDDVESNTLASIARCVWRRKQPKFAFHLFAASLQYRILERTRLGRASQVYFSNPEDLRYLSKRVPKERLHYRPNKITIPASRAERRLPGVFSLLFVGTLDYVPNTDAALWIAEEIVPALREAIPQGFEVVIVGRGASDSLTARLQQEPEIRFVGEVEHLSPYYAASHAALAAVRYGGGTKLKVLEAVAEFCPVITTTHAVSGLPFAADRDVLVADTPQEIAAGCLRLRQHPDSAEQMAQQANRVLHESNLAHAGMGEG